MPAGPLPPVPDFMKVNFNFTIGTNSNCHSHIFLHFTEGPLTEAMLAPTAAEIATAWTAHLSDWHGPQVMLDQIEVEDLGNPGSLPGVAVGPGIGGRHGDIPFADQCVLINFHIPRRYRGGKPRAYMPFLLPGDLQDPQHWGSTVLAGLETAWNAFITACESLPGPAANPCDHSTVSYISGGVHRPTPLTDIVTRSSMNPIPGSQRRRMGR